MGRVPDNVAAHAQTPVGEAVPGAGGSGPVPPAGGPAPDGGGGGFGTTGALVLLAGGLAFVTHKMGLWGRNSHRDEYQPIAA